MGDGLLGGRPPGEVPGEKLPGSEPAAIVGDFGSGKTMTFLHLQRREIIRRMEERARQNPEFRPAYEEFLRESERIDREMERDLWSDLERARDKLAADGREYEALGDEAGEVTALLEECGGPEILPADRSEGLQALRIPGDPAMTAVFDGSENFLGYHITEQGTSSFHRLEDLPDLAEDDREQDRPG